MQKIDCLGAAQLYQLARGRGGENAQEDVLALAALLTEFALAGYVLGREHAATGQPPPESVAGELVRLLPPVQPPPTLTPEPPEPPDPEEEPVLVRVEGYTAPAGDAYEPQPCPQPPDNQGRLVRWWKQNGRQIYFALSGLVLASSMILGDRLPFPWSVAVFAGGYALIALLASGHIFLERK